MKDRKPFYYIQGNRMGTFVRWDQKRNSEINLEDIKKASKKFSKENKNVILVLNKKIINSEILDKNFKKLYESPESIVSDEKYYLYLFLNQ